MRTSDPLTDTSRWTLIGGSPSFMVRDLELMDGTMRDVKLYKTPDPMHTFSVVEFSAWDHARQVKGTYDYQIIAEKMVDYYKSILPAKSQGAYYRILHTTINPDTSTFSVWLDYR